jgi:hypothetical protein
MCACACVCVSLSIFEPISTFFYEFQYGGHVTEGGLDAITDVQTPEMDAKLTSINLGPLSFYLDRSSEDE